MASLMSILKKAGFHGEGLKMAYAIAMAESRGRANAHNSVGNSAGIDRGLFEINSYYHPEVSDAQAYDALANAKAAFRISKGGTDWHEWASFHNGAYKQYYGGSSANVSATTYSGGGGTGVTPQLSSAELAESYGLTSALVNSSGELKSLFKKAVAGGWSADRFQASLKNTRWWKTQSDTLRQYVTQKYTDPATWKQKQQAALYQVNALAVQVGLGSQLNGAKATQLLKDAAYRVQALGWTDARVKDWLGTRVATHDGVMWGEAGEAFDKLHEVAYLNGMKYGSWFEQAARGIARGKSTLETEEAKIRRQAAAKYSAFRDQILAGQNAMDLAAPYIQSVASILELPQTDIDLFNSHVSKAMTARGAKDGSQYSIWQFENDLRADPLWRKTNNAREGMFTVAHQVLKDWGAVF